MKNAIISANILIVYWFVMHRISILMGIDYLTFQKKPTRKSFRYTSLHWLMEAIYEGMVFSWCPIIGQAVLCGFAIITYFIADLEVVANVVEYGIIAMIVGFGIAGLL